MSDYYTPDTKSLDELLQVLADRNRRAVLSYLRESPSQTASVEELADALDARAATDSSDIQTQLHHCHLPRLADSAVIEYDPTTGLVEYAGHRDLESLLDAIDAAPEF